jgi:peptide/nickel transport system substrate-binding protein
MMSYQLLKPRILVVVSLLVVFVLAAACGDDAAVPTPQPTATPVNIAAITSQIQQAVQDTLKDVTAGAVTRADIESVVSTAIAAIPTSPAAVPAAAIQAMVSAAVTAAMPKEASPEEIRTLVTEAVTAATSGAVTQKDVAQAISQAVSDATAGAVTKDDISQAVAAAVLSKSDIEDIVKEALPTATPIPTPTPAAMEGPHGTLDIGWESLQTFSVHPRLTPGGVEIGTTILETLLSVTPDAVFTPKIAKSWSLSADQLVWTFEINEGIQFHGGWGELTAEDVVFSIQQFAHADSLSARAPQFRRLWTNEAGGATVTGTHTIEVDTGVLQADMLIQLASPFVAYIVSKDAVESLGDDEANTTDIGSGPWELVEATAARWQMSYVPNHWRKTPEFAELVFHAIPEESTQLANFQVGRLDTFTMNFDTIPAVMRIPGTKIMRKNDGFSEKLALYGNYYVGFGTDAWRDRNPGYDAALAWVSADPDVTSVEWENARKVRQALSIAIDRDLIVETLLGGEGSSSVLWIWESHEQRLDPTRRKWAYNPETARRLLTEAGYPDGFDITLTPAIRGLAAEIEACHAVGSMWEALGLNVTINNVPFLTLRGQVVSREYQGATCQGTSGRFDPFSVWSGSYRSTAGFASGFNHPMFDALIEQGLGIVDPERQYDEVVTPMAELLYDNAFDFALYSGNVVWPLGPEVDDWTAFMEDGLRKTWTAYEYAPHRQ